MPRILKDQASHTYGVLDPLTHERRDTKFIYAGLDADTHNVVVLPQGGYRDRGGSDRVGRARKPLTTIDLSGATIAAPNGGTAGNLTDGNDQTVLTTNSVSADPFVLFTVDLGSAVEVVAFDINGFLCASTGADDALKVQYQVGSDWLDFGSARHIRTEARNRRFSRAPDINTTAQNWRCVIVGNPSIGAVSISGAELKAEAVTVGPGRKFRAGRSDAVFYELIVTPGNVDVWQSGAFRCSCASAITTEMLPTIKVSSAYDTVLFFHSELEPERLVRQGSDDEWNSDLVPFENIPQVDYGGSYTNAVDAEQEIQVVGLTINEFFDLTLEGNATVPIEISSLGPSTTVNNIKSAIEALSTVDAGVTVTHISGNLRFRVKFTGGRNVGRAWATMTGSVLDKPETAYVSVRSIEDGKPGGEPIMSFARGWPGVGRYAEQRLVLAGFPNRPLDVVAGVTGDPFNLDSERAGATAALVFTIDDDEESMIRDILYRRSLMLFTKSGVHYNSASNLSADETPNFKKSDAPGIDPHTRPMSLSNALYYVHSGGHSLVQLTFSELEQDFIGEPASVLSAYLVDAPRDMTIRRANANNDADVLWYANEDGGLRSVTLMRTQEVSGFAPHVTTGAWRSVLSGGDGTLWQLVERTLASGAELSFEQVNDLGVLDCALSGTNDPASADLTGLEIYNGLSVFVIGDGYPLGWHTVAAGSITLDGPVSAWTAGLWTPPRATDLPFRADSETERRMARLMRVPGARISVHETTSLAFSANGGPVTPLALQSNDEIVFDTVPDPFTGVVHVDGIPGWTEEAQTTVTQVVPGKLTVRGVRKDVVV